MTTETDYTSPDFAFSDWVQQGMEGCFDQFKISRADTAKVERHLRNAAKEQLLAVRSVVDIFIDMVDLKEQKDD